MEAPIVCKLLDILVAIGPLFCINIGLAVPFLEGKQFIERLKDHFDPIICHTYTGVNSVGCIVPFPKSLRLNIEDF